MFICQQCHKTIGPGIGAKKVVTETRTAQYHNVFYREDEWGNREKHEVDSFGYETVKELQVCPDCAEGNQHEHE